MPKSLEPLPQWQFDMYALSLPRGHAFGEHPPIGAWRGPDRLSYGVVTQSTIDHTFGILVLRRRRDNVWTVTYEFQGLSSQHEAYVDLEQRLTQCDTPEPIPSGIAARPALYDLQGRTASDTFKLLTTRSHHPAAWTLNQLYLALPAPDKNWASDCQTANFHTRLWEAQLLASFREQGLLVEQPYESPDFRIENRHGGIAWIEAVTANPSTPYNHVNSKPGVMPTDPMEVFFGPAALRFAKTLGNKLHRDYAKLPHVAPYPFMIALADFQASGSMTWSREALIGYLYGHGAEVVNTAGCRQAKAIHVSQLLGDSEFKAGLFADEKHAELSAVIFSNACSISKLNRVPISASGAPEGLRYTRIGKFFDRTPGALDGIPFCLDITSDQYRALWPQGYEPWTAELEVFHNPFARHPVPFQLLPEATHWYEQGGEQLCRSHYETSILWSRTFIQNENEPPLSVENLLSAHVKHSDVEGNKA